MKKICTAFISACLGCIPLQAENIYLHSGTPSITWKVKPQAEVGNDVSRLSDPRYDMSSWVDAVVPGTVFNSYVVAGYEEDPNFGDNIHRVDRSKYDRSFWYRAEFTVPADYKKELVWLHFNGVNRKADIYLNGALLGTLDGFMHRGRFNVTDIIDRDGKNILAVLVHIPRTPLANQGSPNYLSSGGWDWMPYVPGLNSGITDKVYLSNTGTATLIDPWIRTDLPTNARADLSLELDVENNRSRAEKYIVKGTITPGDITFEEEIQIEAGATRKIKFDKRYYPQLSINSPKLWWPNGYGDPNLYNCKIEVLAGNEISDTRDITFGIRKYTYDKEGDIFHIHINGVPVFVKGANWGMSEYMLRCQIGRASCRERV